MKRIIFCIAYIIACVLFFSSASAVGFSQNPDAIEQATKSVLLLYIVDKNDVPFASGSGFVAYSDSILITNYHVIKNAAGIYAVDDNDNIHNVAYVLSADEEYDVAILELENSSGLPVLLIAPEENLKRGSPVVAIGSPKRHKNTVSIGNISGINKEDVPLIQFTAPISEGSSGGALLNDNGDVIGITTGAFVEGNSLFIANDASIIQAMFDGWDGRRHRISTHPSVAKMDFSKVYRNSDRAEIETIAKQQESHGEEGPWACPNCGTSNTTRFCLTCGSEKPRWICVCGNENASAYCGHCGKAVQDLIKGYDNAIDLLSKKEYEKAAAIFTGLELFNSGSFETASGKDKSAEDALKNVYIAWADNVINETGNYQSAIVHLQNAGLDYTSEKVRGICLDWAAKLIAENDYESAISKIRLSKPENEESLLEESYFHWGEYLYSLKEYDQAIEKLQFAESYSGSDQLLENCYVERATAYIGEGKYQEAINSLSGVSVSSRVMELIKKSNYQLGEDALEAGNLTQAIQYFEAASDYSDSIEQIQSIIERQKAELYQSAKEAKENKDFRSAIDAFSSLDSYLDSADQLFSCYYEYGLEYMEQKKYEIATAYFTLAESYKDAEEKLKESKYFQIQSAYEKVGENPSITELMDVRTQLNGIKEYQKAYELAQVVNYRLGSKHEISGQYEEAIKYFYSAAGYTDASERLISCHEKHVNLLLQSKRFENLYSYIWRICSQPIAYYTPLKQYYIEGKGSTKMGGTLDPDKYVVSRIGEMGPAIEVMIDVAVGMGYINVKQKNVFTYDNKFDKIIQKVESVAGIEYDEMIMLPEIISIQKILLPGMSNEKIQKLNEKLFDLGYIKKQLPMQHDGYEKAYISAVKKIEKDLKLISDGFVNKDEYDQIIRQKSPIPLDISKLSIKSQKDIVTLSWSGSKGSFWYVVMRDDNVIGRTDKMTYKDEKVNTGRSYQYTIYACNYENNGNEIKKAHYVDIYYKPINLIELQAKEKAKDYIKLDGLKKIQEHMNENGDMAITMYQNVGGRRNYVILIIENYNKTDWKRKGFSKVGNNDISVEGRYDLYDKQDKGLPYWAVFVKKMNW